MEPSYEIAMKIATFLGVLFSSATFVTTRFTPRGRLLGALISLAGVLLMLANAWLPPGLALLGDLGYCGVAAALLSDEMRRTPHDAQNARFVEFERIVPEP